MLVRVRERDVRRTRGDQLQRETRVRVTFAVESLVVERLVVFFSRKTCRDREKTHHAPESYATTTNFFSPEVSEVSEVSIGWIRRTGPASPQARGQLSLSAFRFSKSDGPSRASSWRTQYATTSPSSVPHAMASPIAAAAVTPVFVFVFVIGGSPRDATALVTPSPEASATRRPGVTTARRRRCGTCRGT